MRKIVRLVVTSALLLVGAASTAAAGGFYSNYPYGGYGYQYGGAGYYGTASCGCAACSCGCGCGGYSAYAVQQAYEPPIYVVNQGPTYMGPAITVPILNYWSHGALRAYPYIRGGDSLYHRHHHYTDDAQYYPQYAPRIRPHRPYYHHRRVLRVYGAADPKVMRAQIHRRHVAVRRIDPRDLPMK
jgi:hypothetical protein